MKTTMLALVLGILALAGAPRAVFADCDPNDFFDKQAACVRDCGDKKLMCREKYSSARSGEDCEASKTACVNKCGC